MRVGIVALLHESNTFLARSTTIADFEADLLLRGAEVRRLESSHHEIGGFFTGLLEADVEAVPIFAARAIPSGKITAEALDRLLEILDGEIERAGRLDGLLVAPHGAAVCESCADADGFWLARLRQRFGAGFPIIGTLDPHANLSPLMVASTDALIAYRTNPHLDQRERGIEAATLMARTLRGEVRPTQDASFPPLIINIERQRTEEPHLQEQYAYSEAIRCRPNVLTNSLILGFPYADVPKMGSAVVVVTNDAPEPARELADEWGLFLWLRREQFVGHLMDIRAALEHAGRAPAPVCLLDMGDNVGGGSPGDGTRLLHALRMASIGPAFVCLYDPQAVARAHETPTGERIMLAIGGKTDKLHGPPIRGAFTVDRLLDGRFDEPDVRHGGFQSFDMGRSAILRDGGLTIMVTSRRVPPFSLGQLTAAGLDPTAFRVLVAKGVHAPVAAYAPVCRTMIRVNTPGVTSADLGRLEFHCRRRPMFPFEPETPWP